MRHFLAFLPLLLLAACTDPATTPDGTDGTTPTVDPAAVTDSFTYVSIEVRDSFLLDAPKLDQPAKGNFSVSTIDVTNGSPEFRRLVADSLDVVYGGEVARSSDRRAFFRAVIDTMLVNYRAEMEPELEFLEYATSAMRTVDDRTRVVLNTPDLLTVETTYYAYFGGAHGMYSTDIMTFADNPARVLTKDDFLEVGTEEVISGLLLEMVDPESLFEPDAPFPVTSNHGVTKQGLKFIYPPYEIGPYAAGQFEIELPWGLLREQGVLSAAGEELVKGL